jgi:hypothetical protein
VYDGGLDTTTFEKIAEDIPVRYCTTIGAVHDFLGSSPPRASDPVRSISEGWINHVLASLALTY